jgi:hypothetical protein
LLGRYGSDPPSGDFAGSLHYHLGLLVPKSAGDCRIFIDGEPYYWREGDDILFDETYLHYAENTTGGDRNPVLRRRAAAAQPGHDRGQPLGEQAHHQ